MLLEVICCLVQCSANSISFFSDENCIVVRRTNGKWRKIYCDSGNNRAYVCQVRATQMKERYYSREDDFDRFELTVVAIPLISEFKFCLRH